MKKNLIIAGLVTVVIALGSIAYKPVMNVLTEKPVEKSIALNVYRANTYNGDIYNQTSARVHVIVEKVSKRGRSIVFEKTLDAKLLKQYPTADQPIIERIIVPGINDRKEHLEVKYVLTYDTKGSQLEMQSGTVMSKGISTEKLDINI
ncbi:hypothetical protein I5907_10795 [Panacibacter sp. DH6]|uniref:Uncharacterized protein n=1 Tax=Panacibacter microcysteis TaxID=2793269 RepID=A0A931EAG3_9BACT|nr:hypothetical protein [Panacibacter microcysteis]MBG9376726.1 hypothetical protein [Panacibacter microcysteis]